MNCLHLAYGPTAPEISCVWTSDAARYPVPEHYNWRVLFSARKPAPEQRYYRDVRPGDGGRRALSIVPFAEWDNPYFAANTPGRIAALYCDLLHRCDPLPEDRGLAETADQTVGES